MNSQDINRNEDSLRYSDLKKASERGDFTVFADALDSGLIDHNTPLDTVNLINNLYGNRSLSTSTLNSGIYEKWIAKASEATPDSKARLQAILASACGRGASYSSYGVEQLLLAGADSYCAIDEKAYQLAGMRSDMYSIFVTPMATAIDNGHLATSTAIFKAQTIQTGAQWKTAALVCIAPPSVRVEDVEWGDLSAIGFAIACGQTEIFKSLLAEIDPQIDDNQISAGRTFSELVRVGLVDQGPDTVLGDMVTLLAWGAKLNPETTKQLLSKFVNINSFESNSMIYPDTAISFPAMIALSTTRLAGASEDDATKALRVFVNGGLDIHEDVSRSRKGAKLIHFAAASGATQIIKLLVTLGATGFEMDAVGKRPLDYAVAARQPEAVALLNGLTAKESIVSEPTKAAIASSHARRSNNSFDKLKAKQQSFRA